MINVTTWKTFRFFTRVLLATGLFTAAWEACGRVIMFDNHGQTTMAIIAVVFGILWGISAGMFLLIGLDELFLGSKHENRITE